MKNELTKKPKRMSKRKQISVIMNPLKTGEHSKYLNPDILEVLKSPENLANKIAFHITKVEEAELDERTRLVLVQVLTNLFKTFQEYWQRKADANTEGNFSIIDLVNKFKKDPPGERDVNVALELGKDAVKREQEILNFVRTRDPKIVLEWNDLQKQKTLHIQLNKGGKNENKETQETEIKEEPKEKKEVEEFDIIKDKPERVRCYCPNSKSL